MNQNQNNMSQLSDKNNTNLKQQYNTLKQKIINLEKNNIEMIEIYKAEEERLKKSNEFLMKKNNQEHSRTIQELESEVLKMRNAIQQLKALMNEKNQSNANLIENDNLITKDDDNKNIANHSDEIKAKEEYLINYKNKLKTEFEKKLIMKHKEFVDSCIEHNNKIKQNEGNEEDFIDIDEIINFTIKDTPNQKDSKNNKKSSNLEELIKNINENMYSEVKEIEVEKINKIISLLCLKEEYPREFFVDYILDEAYTAENNINQEDSFTKLLELEKGADQEPKNEIERFIQKKPKRKSVFHLSMGRTGLSANKICIKICKLFDIKNNRDIDRIKGYLNKIIKINNNLRHYFEKHLVKYRFAPYEPHEIEKYDEKIKSLFGKDISKIQNLLNLDENIISIDLFEEFNKKFFSSRDVTDDFIYYMLSIMKLTKKQRKEETSKRIKNLGFFDFYLIPLFQKVNK
jgi:hypothetical protein